MRLDEILTRADLQPIEQLLRTTLHAIEQSRTTEGERLLTIDEAAAYTQHTRKTVLQWIREGKPDAQGRIIRLQVLEFQPGNKRIPLSALLAYGKALSIEVNTLRVAA
jgi:uncharacterized protein YaeQ